MSDMFDVVGDDGRESTRSSEPGLVGRGETEDGEEAILVFGSRGELQRGEEGGDFAGVWRGGAELCQRSLRGGHWVRVARELKNSSCSGDGS